MAYFKADFCCDSPESYSLEEKKEICNDMISTSKAMLDDVLLDVEDGLIAGLAAVTERVSGGDLPGMDFAAFLDETFGFIRERWREIHSVAKSA